MSQNDFSIANQTFPQTRADINAALQALASLSSGTTEPSATYPNQIWIDETNHVIKRRDESNSQWIIVDTSDAARVVSKTSDFDIEVNDIDKIFLVDTTSGNVTANLPDASAVEQHWSCVVLHAIAANNLILDGDGSQTINGQTTYTSTRQYEALAVVSDGSNWYIKTIFIPNGFVDHNHLSTDVITGLTEDSSPASGDYILSYDTSATSLKKVQIGNLVPSASKTRVSASRTTSQSIPNATNTKLQYNVENYDTLNEYDPTTNFRFTAASDKYISVAAEVDCDGASNTIELWIYKNGSQFKRSYAYSGATSSGMTFSLDMFLNSGDYVEIYFVQNSGGTINVNAGNLSIHEI